MTVKMGYTFLLLIVCIYWTQANAAYNCTACDKRTCPPYFTPCPGNTAIDPCGCCEHCAKQKWEPCGGPDWEVGYCDKDLRCANITGYQEFEYPNIGICKVFPGDPLREYFEDTDENCPEQNGCYRVMGMCDCPKKRTCILDFHLVKFIRLLCDPSYDDPSFDDLFQQYYHRPCTKSGCDMVGDECVCSTGGCDRTFQFDNRQKCYKTLMERLCANITCPEPKVPICPRGSELTKPHTPYGECCPTVPSYCTCDFTQCVNSCPDGKRMVTVWKTNGMPGSCCDQYLCLL